MLRELMLRDWILNRTALLISFGIFYAFEVYAVFNMDSARVWFVFAAIYASFLAVAMFIREDRFRATAWACTLPVTRAELVRSRFVNTWGLVLLTLGGAVMLAALVPGSLVDARAALEPSTLLVVATTITVVLALLQPFTIRYGMLGVMIFLIGAQVLGVVALSVASLIQRQGGGTGRPIRDALSSIGAGVGGLRDALSPDVFGLFVIVMLVAINWLGYRFSLFLFQRREF